jgi:hypothetical protein
VLLEDGGPVLREDGGPVLREDGGPVIRADFHGAQWIQDVRGVSAGALGSGSGVVSCSISSWRNKDRLDTSILYSVMFGLRQDSSNRGPLMPLVWHACFS